MWELIIGFIFLFLTGVLTFFSIEHKYKRSVMMTIFCTTSLFVILINCLIDIHFGRLYLYKYLLLTLVIPYSIVAFVTSRFNFSKNLFSIMTSFALTAFIVELSRLFSITLAGSEYYIIVSNLISNVLLTAFLCVFIKYRKSYIKVLCELSASWLFYSIIPTIYILLHSFYFLQNSPTPPTTMFFMTCVSIILIITYKLLFHDTMLKINAVKNEIAEKANRNQINALTAQIEVMQQSENNVKIMRHDIKHYINTINTLVMNNDTDDVVEYIDWINDNIEKSDAGKICENAILNACISYHINLARQKNIDTVYEIDIPNSIDINVFELSNVFTNILISSINICNKVKLADKKELFVSAKVIDNKAYIQSKCSNYDTFKINEIGLPNVDDTSVSLCFNSIKSFADKHNAVINYQCSNNSLSFELIIPLVQCNENSVIGG